MSWFCFDDRDGFTLHDTEAEARAEAERRMQSFREHATLEGEWGDGVDSLCWGQVRGRVEMTTYEHHDDCNRGAHAETCTAFACAEDCPSEDCRDNCPVDADHDYAGDCALRELP